MHLPADTRHVARSRLGQLHIAAWALWIGGWILSAVLLGDAQHVEVTGPPQVLIPAMLITGGLGTVMTAHYARFSPGLLGGSSGPLGQMAALAGLMLPEAFVA